MIDLKRVQYAFALAIDGLDHVRDELGEGRAVIGRDCLARFLAFRPCGHNLRLVRVSVESMSATTGTRVRVAVAGVTGTTPPTQCQFGNCWPRLGASWYPDPRTTGAGDRDTSGSCPRP